MPGEQDRAAGHRAKHVVLGVLVGVLGLLALVGTVGLTLVYTGAVNVAATEEHASFTRWALDTSFHNSVERRAADIVAPERFTPEMIAAGAEPYKSMCEHCHAGPGVERAAWAGGMRPRPPHLTEKAAGWNPQEVFWIVKHGVRMTGMPAFGPSHDDSALWTIAAFVKELPAMTPERYAELGGEPQGGADAQTGSTR
jgi:mono/diheme cytochrome c family protein